MNTTYKIALSTLLITLTIACGPDDDNKAANNSANNSATIDVVAQRAAWETCVADTETYTPFETSISTAARVSAFESIGERLWHNDMLTQDDFVQSNLTYVEAEGLDSRLSRREDEHYPAIVEGGETVACNSSEDVATNNPDRCVGPAQIRPIVLGGLTDGAMSMDLDAQHIAAAQVEASLLWFLYVSTYKEANTCTQKKKDCDSSYAYYSGAQPEEMGIGLAGYLRREVPEAHAAVWDGLLEMRCWRQVDSEDTAQNLALRDEVLARMDRALLFGISRLVTARLTQIQTADGGNIPAEWAWLKIMGPVLVREATARDAAKGAEIDAAFAKATFAEIDAPALIATIESIFTSAT